MGITLHPGKKLILIVSIIASVWQHSFYCTEFNEDGPNAAKTTSIKPTGGGIEQLGEGK